MHKRIPKNKSKVSKARFTLYTLAGVGMAILLGLVAIRIFNIDIQQCLNTPTMSGYYPTPQECRREKHDTPVIIQEKPLLPARQ